ncbi:hypothetical protein [Lysobacter capsici]|uniref:hypothetical protein n=1 Tax=Lysobacter capsici TaxID=435897 RepID=UPI00287BA303|nr:hypothetical protein [Lysobacter capsici]WND79444.1 hypothetical protein RJ610_19395 [Lysobacter capsici]WND84640.1 hypothetical protein RJ609_19410 [Lysobacter capsici]
MAAAPLLSKSLKRALCQPLALGLIALSFASLAASPSKHPSVDQAARDRQGQASQSAQFCQDHPERCVAQNNLRYAEVLRDAILAKWNPPAGLAADTSCILDLRQTSGGRVTSVQAVEPCGFDAAGRDSIVAAVLKAQPLPYEGYEQVFRPQLRLQISAPDPDDDAKPSRWRRLRDRVDAIRDR